MKRLVQDLFGNPVVADVIRRRDGRVKKIGYAAPLATGPKRQRCSTCRFAQRVLHEKVYSHKCELMAAIWTYGEETDISLRAPACSQWERKAFDKRTSA